MNKIDFQPNLHHSRLSDVPSYIIGTDNTYIQQSSSSNIINNQLLPYIESIKNTKLDDLNKLIHEELTLNADPDILDNFIQNKFAFAEIVRFAGTGARRAIVIPHDKLLVRNLLCNFNNTIHSSLQNPIVEYNNFNDSKLLYLKITNEQLYHINNLDSVKNVYFEDDIDKNVKLSYDRQIHPGISKSLLGNYHQLWLDYNPDRVINSEFGSFNYSVSSNYNTTEILNFTQPLSTYLHPGTVNYGLYVHDIPFTRSTSHLPNDTGTNITSYNIGSNVDVIIFDTGIDITHVEFGDENGNSRVVQEDWTSYLDDNGNQILTTQLSSYNTDQVGHGTFCASIIGGKTCGWAPGCRLYSIKAIEVGDMTATQGLKLVKAFIKRKKQLGITRPTIINNSWGYSGGNSAIKNTNENLVVREGVDNYGSRSFSNNTVNNAINILVDEITAEGGIMVSAAGNNNDYLLASEDQRSRPLVYIRVEFWYNGVLSFIARWGSNCCDNTLALDNALTNNNSNWTRSAYTANNIYITPGDPNATYYEKFYMGADQMNTKFGMSPSTNIKCSQVDSDVIVVGCVYPQETYGFISDNLKINEKSGCTNIFQDNLFVKSYYSNYGAVDLFAAGNMVVGAISTDPACVFSWYSLLNKYYGTNSGTSFACPQVVGALTNYLNDNINASPQDCKLWLRTNSLSGRIAEFNNSNVEVDTYNTFRGSNLTNLTSFKLPTLRNNNDYFADIYQAEGYNNVTILNTTTASSLPWVYEVVRTGNFYESEDLIFIPVFHVYTTNISTIASRTQMRKMYDLDINTVFLDITGSGDWSGSWTNLPIIDRVSDSAWPNLAYKPFYDYDAIVNYDRVGQQINVFRKTLTGVIYLTSISHPYNLTKNNDFWPIGGGIETDRFTCIMSGPNLLVGATGSPTWDYSSNSYSQPALANISYKNNILAIGDNNRQNVYVYSVSGNSFTFIQSITAPVITDGYIDMDSLYPFTNSSNVSYSRGFYNGKLGKKIDLSDDGQYLAIPYRGITKTSLVTQNPSITGSGYEYYMDPRTLPGVVQIFKNINSTFIYLSTLISDDVHLNYSMNRTDINKNFYSGSTNIIPIFSGSKLFTFDGDISKNTSTSLTANNGLRVVIPTLQDTTKICLYNLQSENISHILSSYDTFNHTLCSISKSFINKPTALSVILANKQLSSYEVLSNDQQTSRILVSSRINTLRRSGNKITMSDTGPKGTNASIYGVGGATFGYTINHNTSAIYDIAIGSDTSDYFNRGSIINVSDNQIKEIPINFNNNSVIANKAFNYKNQPYEYGNLTQWAAHNSGRSGQSAFIDFIDIHEPSGNITIANFNDGKVYFLVPDSTNPTGYKTFTIIHGFTNNYPFNNSRWPVGKNSQYDSLGINTTINNFYGNAPVACFFNSSDTITVLYTTDDRVSTHSHYYQLHDNLQTHFVTFKLNSLDYVDGDCNLTEQHTKYNKNVFLNGHNIFDSPNLVLQSYPKRYIITSSTSDTIVYENKTYNKAGFSRYPDNL